MNDVIEELRDRAAAVRARPVALDWPRLRRARRGHRVRIGMSGTVAGVAIVGLIASGIDAAQPLGHRTTLTVTQPTLTVTQPTLTVTQQTPPASPVASVAPAPADSVQQSLTSYAGRSLAQLAAECQTWAPGVAVPGGDVQLRGLVADSAGAVAAITTDREASTCDFLPDGTVDTSGASDGPYGPENPATRLVVPVAGITSGSGITHRVDNKDHDLVTPVRDTFVARVSSDIASVVVNFNGFRVRVTPSEGVVTATHIRAAPVTSIDITFTAYDATNHVLTTSGEVAGAYTRCDPEAGTQHDDPAACPVIPWP